MKNPVSEYIEEPSNLDELVENCSGVFDFKRKLEFCGVLSYDSSNEQFVRLLRIFREQRFVKRWKEYEGDFDLPIMAVETEGVKYNICGIVHGFNFFELPFFHLRKATKNYLKDCFQKFESGYPVFCEEGLHKFFGDFGEEIGDTSKFLDDKLKGVNRTTLGISRVLLAVTFPVLLAVTFPLRFVSGFMFNKKISSNGELGCKTFTDFIALSLLSPEYHNKYVTTYTASKFSEPFDMQLQNMMYKLNPQWGSAFIVERSFFAARSLKEVAKERQIEELYYVCGADHVTQIAFMLEHPEFTVSDLYR